MKIEETNTSALIPYEFNNRTHDQTQIDRIANSISQFGFNQPIVIDEKNIILVGHGRLAAAKKLNLQKVPTLKIEKLTETQKRAYRILDNKLQDDSHWDFNNLELELGALEDEGFDLEGFGLDELRLNEKEDPLIESIDTEKLESQFRIEITCMSEGHQQEVYEKLKSEGYPCRLLTL